MPVVQLVERPLGEGRWFEPTQALHTRHNFHMILHVHTLPVVQLVERPLGEGRWFEPTQALHTRHNFHMILHRIHTPQFSNVFISKKL